MLQHVRKLGTALSAAAIVLVALLSGAQAQQKIALGVAKFSGHAPFFVGVEKGIYAKHGLDPELKIYPAAPPMLQAQAAGQQDVSAPGTGPFLSAIGQGVDLVAIGALQNLPNSTNFTPTSIVAGPKAGVEPGELAKLKGKKIATFFGTVADQHVRQALAASGVGEKDFELVNMQPPQMITALKTGAVDAIAVWEPFPSLATVQVPGSKVVLRGAGPCTSCYDLPLFVSSKKVISEKKALIEKFWAAHAEAMQYTRTHVDEAADITMRYVEGLDLESLKISLKKDAESMDPRLSKAFLEGLQTNAIPFLVGLGRMKTLDPALYVNFDFQKAAEKSSPQFFSDLKPIEARYQVQ